jgi:CHAT domain-containing protein
LAREKGFKEGTPSYARALMNEGNARQSLADLGVNPIDNLNKAVELYELAREKGFKEGTPSYARALMNEGNARGILAELGVNQAENLNKAINLYNQARELFKKTNNKIDLIKVINNLSNIHIKQENYQKAYNELKESINLIEDVRLTISNPNYRKDFQETFIEAYKKMVLCCLKLDKKEEAFKYAEMSKSRILSELLAIEHELDNETLNKLKELIAELQALENNPNLNIRGDELRAIKFYKIKQIKELEDKLYKENPNLYEALKGFKPISLEELRDREETILMYYIIDKNIYAFVINNGKLEVFELGDIKNVREFVELMDKINEKVKKGVKATTLNSYKKAKNLLNPLYNQLIKPIEHKLKHNLIIIPHSLLHYIPFSALKDDKGKYLIQKYNYKIMPSCTSMKYLPKDGDIKSALLIANPTNDLRFAKEEVKGINKILKQNNITTEILESKNAKKQVVKQKLKDKELIHFSGHGFFNPITPELSGLLLNDGILTPIEFLELKLNAQLMVLSACETGKTKTSIGDEIEGLIRAIQLSGVRYVIASLWLAYDTYSAEIFKKFYDKWLNKGYNIEDAFRETIKEFTNEDFYVWALFQIYGC